MTKITVALRGVVDESKPKRKKERKKEREKGSTRNYRLTETRG